MPHRRVITAAACASGAARGRLADAGEHPAPQGLQPVAPIDIAALAAAAFHSWRHGGGVIHGAPDARCAAGIPLPSLARWAVGAAAAAGLILHACLGARALTSSGHNPVFRVPSGGRLLREAASMPERVVLLLSLP